MEFCPARHFGWQNGIRKGYDMPSFKLKGSGGRNGQASVVYFAIKVIDD